MAKRKNKGRDIMSMSDEEWERHKEEVARTLGWDGPASVCQKPDPRFTERHEGSTPLGGDYSIAYYYDANHDPCVKEEAKFVNIVIYNNDGSRVNEVYGVLGE